MASVAITIEPSLAHAAHRVFKRLNTEADIRGSRISDAWFAARAIEHGCTWVTYDRDCARLLDLDWQLPAV